MRYIEIADGVSVKVDEIESVSKGKTPFFSIVKTHHNIYQSNMPYSTLLQLLGAEVKKEQQVLNILKEVGTQAW